MTQFSKIFFGFALVFFLHTPGGLNAMDKSNSNRHNAAASASSSNHNPAISGYVSPFVHTHNASTVGTSSSSTTHASDSNRPNLAPSPRTSGSPLAQAIDDYHLLSSGHMPLRTLSELRQDDCCYFCCNCFIALLFAWAAGLNRARIDSHRSC